MGEGAKILRMEDHRAAEEEVNMGAEQHEGPLVVEDPAQIAEFREYRLKATSERVRTIEFQLKQAQEERDALIREMRPYMTLDQIHKLVDLSSQRILQIAPAKGEVTRKRK